MRGSGPAGLLLLASSLSLASASPTLDSQDVLSQPRTHHAVDPAILEALKLHDDPVDALIALQPESAAELAQPRLLHVHGEEEPRWLTEGDKLRLRRKGKKFADITEHEEFYASQVGTLAGKAHLPKLSHQRLIEPLLPQVSTKRLHSTLEKLTSFYTRYFGSVTGEESSQWLHDHIAGIIANSPFHTHISLEYFTHSFPQSSIIARFEPRVRNFSAPLTIVGAHQDSMNYLFPLLPAPGADDDGSGTVTILETFRILAESGYTPLNGPVEFHWYAAEEGGMLGSQAIARYKKESRANIGAMMEFDMTAFIAKNATETIGLIESSTDAPLTKWVLELAQEYISIDSAIYKFPDNAFSDYISFTKVGYPSAFACEGRPMTADGRQGDLNSYVHSSKDTMDVDDEKGVFSFEHAARFAELAIAFIVEQAGWDNAWR